jgi:hypothetical protein
MAGPARWRGKWNCLAVFVRDFKPETIENAAELRGSGDLHDGRLVALQRASHKAFYATAGSVDAMNPPCVSKNG